MEFGIVEQCLEPGHFLFRRENGFFHAFQFLAFREREFSWFGLRGCLRFFLGHLTGDVVTQDWGDICDGAEKRKMLLHICTQMGISPKQAIAMGDGANDLLMMGEAGLSVAYHAKPKVREQAMVAINDGGLDRLLEVVKV